ncbi:MAG: metallophosphatase domain-containing protein [Burkholderiales bacterium]|jgi:Icc-related predicted phosphoesterase|nr:metallophosphatase domain-containing protein [Burkholderiales bacterium]
MKIVCISDTHCQHQQIALPAADMIIHAGDFTMNGTLAQINQFFTWFSALDYKYKLVVAGNHDSGMEQHRDSIIIPDNVIYLENEARVIAGIKIWGSPISTPFFNWAFMWPLKQRQQLYKQIEDDVDIIVNHGPPLGTLDCTFNGINTGCPELFKAIERVQPKYCIFGHIHERYGTAQIGATKCVNVACLNRHYVSANAPTIITI